MRRIRPESFAVHRVLYERVRGTEDTTAAMDNDSGSAWINIAASSVTLVTYLAKLTRFMFYRGINIVRLQSEVISDPTTTVGNQQGSVVLIRMQGAVAKAENLPAGTKHFTESVNDLKSEAWRVLLAEVCRLRFLDETTIDLGMSKCPALGQQRAEILDAFCAMAHGPLSEINSQAVSRHGLVRIISKPANVSFRIRHRRSLRCPVRP